VLPRDYFLICLFLMSISMNGCGNGHLPAPSASPDTSSIGCPGNNMPCAASREVAQILVDGTDPATYGIPISCSLTAGSHEMKFITTPSQPWFGVSPAAGDLQPGASTTLGVLSLNAASVSARNVGVVTVTASGYADNSQMAVELNCDVAADRCKVAFSCTPKTNPLP
jgi:hypothetical protein